MKIVVISGAHKGVGKTALARKILKNLKGFGAIKTTISKENISITSKDEAIEVPGKDTALLKEAGAEKVALIASKGFGMQVSAYDSLSLAEQAAKERLSSDAFLSNYGVHEYFTDFDSFIKKVNILTIHLPVNQSTRYYFNSERLGKIKMVRDSINMGNDGPTKNQNVQLDHAVPPSTINNLSSGEVVGMIADTPGQPIELKRFHAHIINNHAKLKAFDSSMEELPIINPNATSDAIKHNYDKVGFDITAFIDDLYTDNCTNQQLSYLFRALEKDRS
ncbi:hypothetical protein LCGC14_2455440 [marine sediment metagenome]|uniref:Molybdopterin-guanine dinucleotide biosynthesis protein B (MobB) domain-containing protein n=1 Tax=marine sediment metagenome TaxID=412755 RepID=A0A0F9BFC6_9ZZZZ